jgi:ADP-ribose pyrophosphatase YjhB (NUDIX family)
MFYITLELEKVCEFLGERIFIITEEEINLGEAKFYYRDKNAPKPNKPIHMGACAIILYNEKVLLEKRTDSNRWALIGGGLNMDESLEQCIIREIKEETGLELQEEALHFLRVYSDPTRIAEYPDGNILRIITAAYQVEINIEHKLVCSEESQELKYFRLDELKNLNIAETHRHIIEDYLLEGR